MMTFRATARGIASAANCAAMTLCIATTSALIASVAAAQQLDPPLDARVEANEAGAESQERVEAISTATDSLIAEFRLTNKKIESLQIFNRQLGQVIDSQNEELASLQEQIDSVEEVGRAVTPLMLKMIEAKANEEYAIDDGASMPASALHHWLTRIMYQRRSKMDPLWNR